MGKKRVVITSMGFVTPIGSDCDSVMESFRKKISPFKKASYDNELCVADVDNFNLKDIIGRCKNGRYLNRGASFAVASAVKAVKNSNLTPEMLSKAGLFTGVGPNMDIGNEIETINNGEIDRKGLNALWLLKFLPNTAASVISGLTGVNGENLTIATACATSLQVVGEAFRKIRDGYLDVALAGSCDSRNNPGGSLSYKMAGALSSDGENPEKCMKPFDKSRNGFSSGEGGGFFVLEELSHAEERGSEILCEITGYGASMDGGNMTAPDPDGIFMEKAVANALNESNISPRDVDLISAHGTGTTLNDQMESDLINRTFHSKPYIIALKSWIGHLSAACGAAELAIVLTLIKNGYLPEIRNLENPISDELNFVRKPIETEIKHVLLENFGFGGQNGALLVKKWD